VTRPMERHRPVTGFVKKITNGSALSPAGFLAGTAVCGFRGSPGDDLALLVSKTDCAAAGVFTRNRMAAAPVVVDRETLAAQPTAQRVVVTNAGVANAGTGVEGIEAARATQAEAARLVGCRPDQVLVLSTGVIGELLEMDKMVAGLGRAASSLSGDSGLAAARAIMTTDTRPKHLALEVELSQGRVRLGGMAKGAGMIHPDMATLLGILTTDAQIPEGFLGGALRTAVDRSFHRISVDGDTSTNDSVLILANGASQVPILERDRGIFGNALEQLCVELAQAVVRDGEGATKFVHLQVTGAPSVSEAVVVGRVIATSPLVKTALAGGDPNWGRILAAAGRAGVDVDPGRWSLWIGPGNSATVRLLKQGKPLPANRRAAVEALAANEVTVRLDLDLGQAAATVWTCDLTHEYVTINAEYHT